MESSLLNVTQKLIANHMVQTVVKLFIRIAEGNAIGMQTQGNVNRARVLVLAVLPKSLQRNLRKSLQGNLRKSPAVPRAPQLVGSGKDTGIKTAGLTNGAVNLHTVCVEKNKKELASTTPVIVTQMAHRCVDAMV